jgi:hypothetical protein
MTIIYWPFLAMTTKVVVRWQKSRNKKEGAAMSKDMPPSADTPITRGQVDRLYDRFVVALCKSGLPREPTQYVLENEGVELVDEFVIATRRRVEARQRATEPHILKRQPFDPEQFMGMGWTIGEQIGRRTEDNLDAERIVGKNYLREGESSLIGEERLLRIKVMPDVQLDADDFLALWQEKDHVTLEWLYDTKGITFLSFWGTILRDPSGYRIVLYLHRDEDGLWYGLYFRVDCDGWDASNPSSVLAQ